MRRLVHAMVWAALLLARPAAAQEVMALVRADRWAEARAAVATHPDPVARKLVTYYRLLAPNAATAGEIAAFMAENPDWPQQATLARRRDLALAADPDDAAAAAQCDATPPTLPEAVERCAAAFDATGHADAAAAAARAAWVAAPADPAIESRLAVRWGAVLRAEDEARRFDRLAWTDTVGAARQLPRLTPAERPAAAARLALRGDAPNALALVAALPAAARAEPALVLEQARYLRRAGQDAAALALWREAGTEAERAAPDARRPAFWEERNILVRRRLRDGDAAGAYALADGHAQTQPEQVADAEFLAGFIALRRLSDPAGAVPHFQAVARVSRAAITRARAAYWLGRAAVERHDAMGARDAFAQGAAWPTTFYGQLAARAGGETDAALARRIAAARDPVAPPERALLFAGRELARASAILVAWGEPRRAAAFLLRLGELAADDDTDRALAARLAGGLGLPDAAVAIARRAGRDGQMLPRAGWPLAAEAPADGGVEPALVLGIIRQESSFDPATVSPVGARGLMQLMPATAKQVAASLSLPPPSPAALITDPAGNIRLGTAYLRTVLDAFDGAAPLAVAAYNAGPARVREWLGTNGDPLAPGGVDMLDWIELIPFGETRNYVQRVIENQVVYRAKTGTSAAHPLARWLG